MINFKEGLIMKNVTYKVEGLEIFEEISGIRWDSNPIHSLFYTDALTTKLLESHGSGAEDKLYTL